jgi:hypothetical protein
MDSAVRSAIAEDSRLKAFSPFRFAPHHKPFIEVGRKSGSPRKLLKMFNTAPQMETPKITPTPPRFRQQIDIVNRR